jgi:hypothetical protein
MIIRNGIFHLEDRISCNPQYNRIEYTDKDNNTISIPHTLLIGLYELVKFEKERQGVDFEKYKQDIIND